MKKKFIKSSLLIGLLSLSFSCSRNDDDELVQPPATAMDGLQFSVVSQTALSNAVSEISAYDPSTKQLFVVALDNATEKASTIQVLDISNPSNPIVKTSINVLQWGAAANSVDVKNGKLAIAVEGFNKTDNGKIVILNTTDLSVYYLASAGALPDMVKFSPDGKYVLSANEGEPNSDYSIDPMGSVTIVDVAQKSEVQLGFDAFEGQVAVLKQNYFRITGKNTTFSKDIEPEYVAISSDSKYAYITLQENNGMAKINLTTKSIEKIIPLGVKDYSLAENAIDISDKEAGYKPKTWSGLKGYFMPDAIDFMEVNGSGYLVTANEGDGRDYTGYLDEVRIKDIALDPTRFPTASELKKETQMGRLKVVNTYGDTDGDGDYDELYAYGGRSFSIWSTEGSLIYDSRNILDEMATASGSYDDSRSDDKSVEPEGVASFVSNGITYLAVGLERAGEVLIFNMSNPSSPQYVQSLKGTSPEGLLVIPAKDSPNGKTLLVVSNEFPSTAKLQIFSK